MKKSFFNFKKGFLISCIVTIGAVQTAAQLPLLEQFTNQSVLADSTETHQFIDIAEVNKEIEFTDNLLLKKNFSASANEKRNELILSVDNFNLYIEKQGKEFKSFEISNLSHFFLTSARITWSEFRITLRKQREDLQRMIRDVQNLQNDYVINKDKWEKSLPHLNKSISPQIKQNINSNIQKLNAVINEYDLIVGELLTAENKVLKNIYFVETILNDINHFNNKRKTELLKRNKKSIFTENYRGSYPGTILERLNLVIHENTKTFGYFFSNLGNSIIRFALILSLFIYLLFLVRTKYKALNNISENPNHQSIKRILTDKIHLTIFSVAMFSWIIFVPYTPLFLSLFIFLATLTVLLVLLSPLMNRYVHRITQTVIVLLTLSIFEIFAWYFGNYSRFYLLVEAITGLILTYQYIQPGYKIAGVAAHNKRRIFYSRLITFLLFILYSVGFFSNILGFVNLSVYCIKLGVYSAFFSLLVINLSRLFDYIFEAAFAVLNPKFPELVKNYGDIIIQKLKLIIRIIFGWLWTLSVVRFAEFYEFAAQKISYLLTNKIVVGSITFALGNVILFFLILYLTYYIAKFVKVIIEREILARQNLKRGFAASISLTIRILLVFLGTLIALSYSGMDLTKIGIIAGALSVGIGFGLQNIVSNFISGLILIYEKPIQEGDTIEVGTLLGKVSNIGIRSSTVSTYDGAEVVVPNSNLISDQLINWTLSDNQKRIEIKVGTAYGTDPRQVLKLLMEAALSHESVLKVPEPRPLFLGFGNSSLDFRLLFWVPFEHGLQTQSEVAIKIYEIFNQNNIEIPFPQLDLHVKNPEGEQGNNKTRPE